MPATRLLVVADSKMLTSLATGLREGARFEVAVAPLSDPNAAQAAAATAEAVALFYGGPAAVQALAARLRDRGGRMVAVLQREQLPQRDDCFRAGASDLLFMPMPKDQFVNRLSQAVALSFEPKDGSAVDVTVATRTATLKLEAANVTPAGIESATSAEAQLKPGETVRLTFGDFQAWGLVARAADPLQIRFAGLTPDEEAKIRKWLDGGAQPAPSQAATPPNGEPAARAPAVEAPAEVQEAAISGESARVAPASGPPPGFADRKPVRGSTRPAAARGPPPILTPPATPAVAAPPPPPPTTTTAAPVASEPASGLGDLFGEGAGGVEAVQAPAVPAGPAWPTVYSVAACKTAALMVLQDNTTSPEASPSIVASARKVTSGLGSAEREALQKAGSDSSLADALAARVLLDAATSDGVKLYSASPAPAVDAAAVAALTKVADEAAARLQKEASAAVTKGEVESLQAITAANAPLSRDLLALKETADRLRGLATAPRLGAGALDPEVVLPGQTPRAVTGKPAEKQQVRAELRDFQNLGEDRSDRWKKVFVLVGSIAFVVLAANAFYFGIPRMQAVPSDAAGKNVESIDVHGPGAVVVINQEWIENAQSEVPKLLEVLRQRQVTRAMLMTANGRPAGVLFVDTGKIVGLPTPSTKKK